MKQLLMLPTGADNSRQFFNGRRLREMGPKPISMDLSCPGDALIPRQPSNVAPTSRAGARRRLIASNSERVLTAVITWPATLLSGARMSSREDSPLREGRGKI